MDKQNTCAMCEKDWGDVLENTFIVNGKEVTICLCLNCKGDITDAALKTIVKNGVDLKAVYARMYGRR